MPQIVVTFDPSCGVDPRKAALWCAALDVQVREFCSKQGLLYIPVNFYSSDVLMKLSDDEITKFANDSYLVTVQTTMDVQGALGYHNDIAGVIFARVLWQGDDTTITLSHEILELLLDMTCDVYKPYGNGTEQAFEACDRVEGNSYVETGTIGTDSIPVNVSNYLLPAAFVENSTGPWDRMNKLTTWNGSTSGGYTIVRDSSGNTTDVFARHGARGPRVIPGGEPANATIVSKLTRGDSRLMRRLQGHVTPMRLAA